MQKPLRFTSIKRIDSSPHQHHSFVLAYHSSWVFMKFVFFFSVRFVRFMEWNQRWKRDTVKCVFNFKVTPNTKQSFQLTINSDFIWMPAKCLSINIYLIDDAKQMCDGIVLMMKSSRMLIVQLWTSASTMVSSVTCRTFSKIAAVMLRSLDKPDHFCRAEFLTIVIVTLSFAGTAQKLNYRHDMHNEIVFMAF